MTERSRRRFLRGLLGAGVLAGGRLVGACNASGSGSSSRAADGSSRPEGATGGNASASRSVLADVGPLRDADVNGVRLPEGFSSRVVAISGQRPVPGGSYTWHPAPDGGATFATGDGGWIYVSNSEFVPGGVGALRFDARGEVVDAYGILEGEAILNCAGGPTPWGTWISCEEHDTGRAWECDPTGAAAPRALPALGVFAHEAVAVDPDRLQIYLTEDEPDGRLYRFTSESRDGTGKPDLHSGLLEVAQVQGDGPEGDVVWLPLPDPSARGGPTRQQLPHSTSFHGGEGIWYRDGFVYFTTKGDNRVWAYEIARAHLSLVYDLRTTDSPILSGVDNITASPAGDLLVAEDGGDMQVVALTPQGAVVPLVQVEGHDESEITGPAFDPSGTRLYFSSQRGPATGALALGQEGVTFEVTGPFFER